MEEVTANNHVSSPISEKIMDKNQSLSHGDGGKESLKLRISTNHADGTSKIVSQNTPSSHYHNHVSKDKDGIRKDAISKSKHGHDGEKAKEHKHKEIKDSSHNDKHKDHKSKSSQNHHDSNSKPKENHNNSSSEDIRNKENSSSSKPKDGLNNSISKPKDHSVKLNDSKSSGGSRPSEHSSKPKVSSNNLNHTTNSVKENSVNSKPKEHGSSHKLKESGSSKPKESSSKPKDSSSKPKDSSSGKPKESSGSKHKESSSKPRDSTGSSKPKESSSSKPKDGSSSSKPKGDSGSTKPKDTSVNSSSTPKVKENSEKSSSSSSSKPKSSGDKLNSSSSSKPKDGSSKEKSEIKDGKSSGKPEDKANSIPVKVKQEKPDDANSTPVKIKQEKPDDEKKHHNKEIHGKKDASKEHKHKDGSSSKHKSKEPTKDVNEKDKSTPKIKEKIKEKSSSEKHGKNHHKSNDSSKNIINSTMSPVKKEISTDDDLPLAVRKDMIKKEQPKREQKSEKRYMEASDSEDEPLSARIENAKKLKKEPSRKRQVDDSDDEPISKKLKTSAQKKSVQNKKTQNISSSPTKSPTKKKKQEDEQEVWKWWEEEKLDEGVKWRSLEHKGPVFAPDYEPLPKSVKFFYNGEHMVLNPEAEEVATFYSKFLDHEYSSKEAFNKNFFRDWRKVMTAEEKAKITDLKLCNFRQMNQYFNQKNEERKNMTKEEKLEIKKKNEEMLKEYGFCIIDGHKEKIGNFKIEPPGLFRGRGEHPKMGMLKKRILPKDVTINCSKGSKVPKPPEGHRWKEVRHDNTVTWLACWNENIQGSNKYIMLNPSSKLKGEKDFQKYEIARKLKGCVDTIRDNYKQDWKSKEMRIRQRAVALYFIDKLALRAGNEKEEGETADTVGCCSLRYEHITLDEEKDGQEYVVNFDFLGKDSIRYMNSVPVEKRVFKNLQLFMENKQTGDDLFDRLNTTILNKHLTDLMEGLTAKVFRTFNASKTLQEQLDKLTDPRDPIPAKLLSYNRANRAVAILCNHQRAVPKTFDKSMENLQGKIQAKNEAIKETKKELKDAKKAKDKATIQRKEKALERLKDQLVKIEIQVTDKEENKQIALGTSKLNYLDPRITVAWCKKWEVPIEKVYNKTQRDKFRWAIEMAGPDYVF